MVDKQLAKDNLGYIVAEYLRGRNLIEVIEEVREWLLMDKDLFRKIEGRLYRYFEDVDILESLEIDIKELHIQRDAVIRNIQEVNVSIEADLNMGVSYAERVQTSADGSCYAEKEMFNQIRMFEKELREIKKSIWQKEHQIRDIRRSINSLRRNIGSYDEETKMFLKLKYKDKKSDDAIAVDMFGGVRSTAYRKRVEVVDSIIRWSKIYETKLQQL